MNIKQALETYLLAQSGLTALVSDRIYFRDFPQGTDKKSLLINKISAPRETAMVTDPGIVLARFQFSAIGTTEKEPDDILDQVRTALQNYTGVMGGAGGVQVDYTELVNEYEIPVDINLTGFYLNGADWYIYYHE